MDLIIDKYKVTAFILLQMIISEQKYDLLRQYKVEK